MVKGRRKQMKSEWRYPARRFAAFVITLLMCPFSPLAQVALDQTTDSGAITPAKPLGEGTAGFVGRTNELKVSVTLKDGSQIIGTPVFKALMVTTPYGKLETKVEMLESVQFAPDHESVKVTVRNGDALSGSLGIHEFEINTLFGKIRIETAVVTSLQVLSGDASLAPVVTNGLVLYFPFDTDENGKVTDRSGKKNHGIVHGAKWVQQGKHGGAYEFDGVNNHILVPDSDSLHMRNVTVMAWIYATDISGYSGGMIVEKRPHDGCWELLHFDEGRLLLRGAAVEAKFTDRDTVKKSEWMHVAGVIDGNTGVLYLNGKAILQGAVTTVSPTTGEVLIGMGRNSHSSDDHFKGIIDEVMIFDRALSAEEVKKLYDLQR
jgi:hypothetical protein